MFKYSLAFLLGMLCIFIISDVKQAVIISCACFVVGISCVYFKIKHSIIFYCLAGVIWASFSIIYWLQVNAKLVESAQKVKVSGYICSIPELKFETWRFDFCVVTIDQHVIDWFEANKVSVSWGKYANQPEHILKSGQFWELDGKILPIHGRLNPNAFDYERFAISQNYFATFKVKNSTAIQKPAYLSPLLKLKSFYHQSRNNAFAHFNRVIPEGNSKALIFAMLMGERAGIKTSQWEIFKQSGTSHLLAISGLHVGIAALWCYWVVCYLWKLSNRLCLLVPAQRMGEIAAIVGAIWITLLSGLGLPAQRAVLMLIIFFIAKWSGRHYTLTSVIGLSMLVILLLQPLSLLSVSFWLSFIAVTTIAFTLNRQAIKQGKIKSWLMVNWYLYVILIPVSCLFFDMASWVSLLANLILIPFFTFVLTPLIYLAGLTLCVNDKIAAWLFIFCSYLMDFCTHLQSYLADLNVHLIFGNFSSFSLLMMFLIVCSLLLPKGIVHKIIIFPLLLVLALSNTISNESEYFEMWVFDIGQGLAIYIETRHENLLFDTGWGSAEYSVANSAILPFFEKRRISHLDRLVISHGDSDHAGGIVRVQNSLSIDKVVAGEKLIQTASESCHSYPAWNNGAIQFEFLNHLPINQDSVTNSLIKSNNASCVLSINVFGEKILLTGDIEKQAEKRLIQNGLTQHTVVVAPHHGSKTSSTNEFVQVTKPRHVIFSTGYANQWYFPRNEVVTRYTDLGGVSWVTHQQGAVKIYATKNKPLEITSLRKKSYFFGHKISLYEK